jgi:DNA replication protein DnaC
MLNNAMIEGLLELKLDTMAMAIRDQRANPDYLDLPFEDRLGLLVDIEIQERQNRKRRRLTAAAKLRASASIEDIDFRHKRGLDKSKMLSLASASWVREHHNIVLVGASGLGKTYLACALVDAAIRQGHSALYLRAPRLFEDLDIARGDGRYKRQLASLARLDVLVIDDLFLRPLHPDHAADLLEVIEDRHQVRSTILASQLPVADWHDAIGDGTMADAVLDRVLHREHRIELHGESMRTPEPPDRRRTTQDDDATGQTDGKED